MYYIGRLYADGGKKGILHVARVSLVLVLLFLIVLPHPLMGASTEEDDVTIVRPRHRDGDTRFEYYTELVRILMEATVETHGGYEWKPWHEEVSPARQQKILAAGRLMNVVYSAPTEGLNSAGIPVKLNVRKGINGYRLLLIRKTDQPRFSKVASLEELRKFTAGQAKGWPDVKIYESNGLPVSSTGDFESMFPMLRAKRFDYYPLGITEAPELLNRCGEFCQDIAIENSIILHYPFPIFLYVSRSHPKLAQRLTDGMEIVVQNGVFEEFWQSKHRALLKAVAFEGRTQIKMINESLPEFTEIARQALWIKAPK